MSDADPSNFIPDPSVLDGLKAESFDMVWLAKLPVYFVFSNARTEILKT